MLQVKNLAATHIYDLRAVFEDVSFTLNDGDKAVIIGEEGNGKSTLLKLIYDPALVRDYIEHTGEIVTRGLRLSYLPQDMEAEDKTLTVGDFFAATSGFYDLTPREVAVMLRRFGFQPEFAYSDQIVGTLSGGERVKLQLMRILIEQPDALLLDEPSNDIDIETLEWLEGFINGFERPVLFVSHDETLIENTANVVIHLELVRRKTAPRCTVARMPYARYIETRTSALSYQEQQARREKSEHDAKVRRLTQLEQNVHNQLGSISRRDPHGGKMLKRKMKAVKSLEKRVDREGEEMTRLPDVEDAIFVKFDADVSVPNGKTVLDFGPVSLTADGRVLAQNVALTVTGPERVCITGRNGVGKTTLLRMIAGELTARQDIKCGYMPQNYEDMLDFAKTPVELLAVTHEHEETTRIRTLLGSARYTPDEMSHAIKELSGGQKAKLMFIKMILDGCNVLVLDEPTRNLSPMSNPVVREMLCAFGGAIISVSHDRKYIAEVCDTVYALTADGLERRYS